MRLTWRDTAATLLVGAATAVYLGQKLSVPIPLITDRSDVAAAALLLGFVACVVDEWTVKHDVLVRTLSVFGVSTLGVGIAAMATESEPLLEVVVAMLVTLWAVTTLAHAGVIAQRANSGRVTKPRPLRSRPAGWRGSLISGRVRGEETTHPELSSENGTQDPGACREHHRQSPV